MMTSKTKVTIAYCGNLVDNGTMDVRSLGPALIAFGDLISECNKVLNNDDSKISVNVNADFQKGSFEIQLDLIRSVIAQVQSMFGDTTFTMDNISMMLGIVANGTAVGGAIAGGLIGFLKWLRGRKIDKAVDNKDGTISIHVDGEHVIINKYIVNIYQSVSVRESLQKVLGPLKTEGIDSFEVRNTGKNDKNVVSHIDKKEIDYFDVSDNLEKITNVSTQTVLVKILSVSFEENKWRLLFGSEKIYANIEDDVFAKKVKEGKISFTNGDTLRIILEVTQTIENDSSIKNTYSVLKVTEVIKRPQQIELKFE
jgi:hypothetical protein